MSTIESLTQGLNIAERLSASWRLIRVSVGVVRREPALIGITLLGGLSSIALPILFIAGISALLLPGALGDFLAGRGSGSISALFVVAFIGYTIYSFIFPGIIGAFFGGATAEIAMRRIEGTNPSIGDGLGAARRRLGALAVFGAITGIIGGLTSGSNRRDDRDGGVEQAAAELYRLLTCLSLPAIMREPIGGTAAIGRSTAIMRQVWPQAIASGYSIRAATGAISSFFGIILFAIVGLTIAGVVGDSQSGMINSGEPLLNAAEAFNATYGGSTTGASGMFGSLFDDLFGGFQVPGYALVLAVVCLIAMRVISTIGSLLEAVFNGALYLYATTGRAGDFAAADLARAAVTSDGVVKPGAAHAP